MPTKRKKFDLSRLRLNPSNPYPERDQDFPKFLKKLEQFPKFLELRPIVYDDQDVEGGKFLILGGNKRYRGLIELGYDEVPSDWVKAASSLSDEEKHEFIVADNVGFGEWDFSTLLDGWGEEVAESWSIEIPNFDDIDYSDKNKEIDVNEFEDQAVIKLNYTLEEYEVVKTELHKIADTPEQAVWQLLGLNE